ncbi:bifunctional glyoxylate/hydroxypyruvate reductase A [[Pantoea] beijingensis]|uniref:Bifunctional glyoxylate/hydroxypyruvate reductase A n=1 Tax=[Pantoea] beijingensis TaxID=1324864 RepID=A0A443IHA6_9GAMM|nr:MULTISPECIES: glyoxylate/hydroxypyruvate reductase GhrA [Erwiniaceae]RWR03416.1 bifunctional glyoxylate/hydroxypyruvate reductase A [[Pantoea] beijingensis]
MDIIFYHPTLDAEPWARGLKQRLPGVNVRQWLPGDSGAADYALVRMPPIEMLQGRHALKGVFALGAGVDDILTALKKHPAMLPPSVPLFRLEDTGMGLQMQEYAVYTVLGWFRRFDDYRLQKQQVCWQPLPGYSRKNFVIGILGAGVLGRSVADSLTRWGFSVRCWSQSPKDIAGVASYHGVGQFRDFLAGTQVLINLLPHTPQTVGIINLEVLNQLNAGAFVLNLARGAHLVEADLLSALDANHIKAAALDVFITEPLPTTHPLWLHPRVAITPHNAAVTLPDEAMDYIASAIQLREAGDMPSGRVDLEKGY